MLLADIRLWHSYSFQTIVHCLAGNGIGTHGERAKSSARYDHVLKVDYIQLLTQWQISKVSLKIEMFVF
jgi:hypothetical protein